MGTLTRQNHMQKGGNGPQATEQFMAPVATVSENGDGYTLQVEMPGVNKEGLEICVKSNELTIVGRRSLPPVSGRSCIVSRGGRTFGVPLGLILRSTSAELRRRSSKVSSH